MTPTDDELMEALRSAVSRVDGPPVELHEANAALLSWRDPDAELAALVADSRQLEESVRGRSDSVLLRFGSEGHSITVEIVEPTPGRLHVTGRIEPGAAGPVRIRRPDGETTVECDAQGRWQAEQVGRGAVSFRWTPAGGGGPAIETPWLLL